jgi:phage shock protein E
MKVDINITAIVILVIFIGGAYGFYRYAMDSQYRISADTAKKLLATKQFDVVVDVRTVIERNTLGSYPGSVHIPSQELTKKMPMMFPDKETRILVYCNTGQRARTATEILQSMGYTNAVYIASGHTSIM